MRVSFRDTFLFLSFVFFALHLSAKEANPDDANRVELDRRVNRHLIDTQNQLNLEKSKRYIETQKSLQSSKQQKVITTKPQNDDVILEQEDNFSQAIPQDSATGSNYTTPTDQLHRNLSGQQKDKEYQKTYEKEYVKAFRRNAAAAGVDVQVDSDLKVKDVHEREESSGSHR